MLRTTFFAAALALPGIALACGGPAKTASADTEVQLAAASADATKCAKSAALVGSSCRFSTGQMAQRVHAEGKATQLTATLQRHEDQLDSHVAAPYTVDGMYVIANEVVDQIEDPTPSLALSGKVLEVNGVTYFLVEGFDKSNT